MPESEPLVVQVMREFRADILARDFSTMQTMSRRWGGVEDRLQDLIDNLANDIASLKASGETVSAARLYRMERYQRFIGQLRGEVNGFSDWAEREITKGQRDFGRQGIASVTDMLGAIGAMNGVELSFDILPVEAVENMVGLLADGSPLRKILRDLFPTALEAVNKLLIENTALGVNPRETARQMVKAMQAGLQRALVIARDAQIRVFRQAALDSMKASGVVRGYQRISARDTRVCLGCLVLDNGKIYPLSQPFAEHTQGRCSQIPVVQGYPAAKWVTGPQWLARQSESAQREIIGNTRYELWRSGQDLNSFVLTKPNKTWGPSVGLKPLGGK